MRAFGSCFLSNFQIHPAAASTTVGEGVGPAGLDCQPPESVLFPGESPPPPALLPSLRESVIFVKRSLCISVSWGCGGRKLAGIGWRAGRTGLQRSRWGTAGCPGRRSANKGRPVGGTKQSRGAAGQHWGWSRWFLLRRIKISNLKQTSLPLRTWCSRFS